MKKDSCAQYLKTAAGTTFHTPYENKQLQLHKEFAYNSTSTIINLQPKKCTQVSDVPQAESVRMRTCNAVMVKLCQTHRIT
jgi:hypothetical protein